VRTEQDLRRISCLPVQIFGGAFEWLGNVRSAIFGFVKHASCRSFPRVRHDVVGLIFGSRMLEATQRRCPQFHAIQIVVEVVKHLDHVGDNHFFLSLSHHVRDSIASSNVLRRRYKSFPLALVPNIYGMQTVPARYLEQIPGMTARC
jgi:hypothetical protein